MLAAYVHPAWMPAAAGVAFALARFLPAPLGRACLGHLLVLVLGGLIFFLHAEAHSFTLLPPAEQGQRVTVRGSIDSPVKRDGDTARFFFSVESWESGEGRQNAAEGERIALRVNLESEEEALLVEGWRPGSVLEARAQLSLPEKARNPHAFDYSRYLYWQGVLVTAETSFQEVRILQEKMGWKSLFLQWQQDAAARIDLLYSDAEAAGYMKSLLLGLQEEVSPDLAEMYADMGLSHVLAISGLHVTLVSGMMLWLLERAGVGRKQALLISVLLLAGYVMLVGASASAVRSGIMGGVGLVCQAMNRRLDGREVWACALLVMLAFNPFQLWHVGFQLSFAVTLGLIVFVPFSQQAATRLPLWLRALAAVTIVAQVVSFPFLIYHFHQFSPLSWLVNLIATPILSAVVLPLGYAALLLGMIHPALALWPVFLSSGLLRLLHAPLFFLQELKIPYSHWPHPEWWWLALYAAFLLSLPWLWQKGYHRRRDLCLYLVLFVLLVAAARQPFAGANQVRITFLDVGQGDSIVVEVGREKVYLVDVGGNPDWPERETWRRKRDPFEPGKDIVLPFLRSRGIHHVDTLVLTHGDRDHMGGMASLLPRLSFGKVLVGGQGIRTGERELYQQFLQQGVPVLTGKPGDRWTDKPEVQWEWLHPARSFSGSENDASVVLKLTAYNTTVLFTGDIGTEGENELLERGLTSVDVLKVAHHGSRSSTSQAFLAATRPKIAVISAGRNNRYGHPAADVLKRLESSGSKVLRTDQDGAVTLLISPEGFSWKSAKSDS